MRSDALHVSNLDSHIGCKVLQNGALNPFSASPPAQKNGKSRSESATKVLELGMECSIDSNIYAAIYIACEVSCQYHCQEFYSCVEEVLYYFPTQSHDNTRPNSNFCV